VASAFVLYQAAFAALVETTPHTAARSITYLTLIAGFASTLFWAITTALHAHLSWRDIYLIYAALNLVICLPLHTWIVSHRGKARRAGIAPARPVAVAGVLAGRHRRMGLVLATVVFALQGYTLSAILVHMVPMLTTIGLGGYAVMVGAIFGPSQVFSRLINMVFGQRISPVMLAMVSGGFMSAGIGTLLLTGNWLPGAILFAVLLGLGSGINSIAQGSLPLWLFGSEGYGALTGKMAAVRLVASAVAPFAFAVIAENAGMKPALAITAILGLAGIGAFLAIGITGRSDQQENMA
jgi:hypothetical protein